MPIGASCIPQSLSRRLEAHSATTPPPSPRRRPAAASRQSRRMDGRSCTPVPVSVHPRRGVAAPAVPVGNPAALDGRRRSYPHPQFRSILAAGLPGLGLCTAQPRACPRHPQAPETRGHDGPSSAALTPWRRGATRTTSCRSPSCSRRATRTIRCAGGSRRAGGSLPARGRHPALGSADAAPTTVGRSAVGRRGVCPVCGHGQRS